MEDHSDKSKHPNLPPNYVTLLQLQERWIKEQQQKHEQKEQQPPQLQPNQNQRIRNLSQPILTTPQSQCHGNPRQTEEAGAVAALMLSVVGQSGDNQNAGEVGKNKNRRKVIKKKDQQPPQLLLNQNQDRLRNLSQPVRRTPHSQCHGTTKPTEEAGTVTALTVSVVGESEDDENTENVGKNKNRRKAIKKKITTTSDKQEEVKETSGVKEAQADYVGECERRARVVKTRKANANAKKYDREKKVVVEYRPKISYNAARKSDGIEGKMVNAVEESDRMVKVEGKMLNAAKKSIQTVEIQSKKIISAEESGRMVKIEEKMMNAVEESDRLVKIEGKLLNAVKKSNQMVEIQSNKANVVEEGDRTMKNEGKKLNSMKKNNWTVEVLSKTVNIMEESDRTVKIEQEMLNVVKMSKRKIKIPNVEESDWRVKIEGKNAGEKSNVKTEIQSRMVNALGGTDRTSHIEGKMVKGGEESDGKTVTQSRMVNAVEGGDRTLHIESKMVNKGNESDVKVGIERKLGVKEENGVKKQTRVVHSRVGRYGGYGDGLNSSYGRSRGGGYGYCGANVRRRRGYDRDVHRGEQTGTNNGMVWVRKTEVADGGSSELLN